MPTIDDLIKTTDEVISTEECSYIKNIEEIYVQLKNFIFYAEINHQDVYIFMIRSLRDKLGNIKILNVIPKSNIFADIQIANNNVTLLKEIYQNKTLDITVNEINYKDWEIYKSFCFKLNTSAEFVNCLTLKFGNIEHTPLENYRENWLLEENSTNFLIKGLNDYQKEIWNKLENIFSFRVKHDFNDEYLNKIIYYDKSKYFSDLTFNRTIDYVLNNPDYTPDLQPTQPGYIPSTYVFKQLNYKSETSDSVKNRLSSQDDIEIDQEVFNILNGVSSDIVDFEKNGFIKFFDTVVFENNKIYLPMNQLEMYLYKVNQYINNETEFDKINNLFTYYYSNKFYYYRNPNFLPVMSQYTGTDYPPLFPSDWNPSITPATMTNPSPYLPPYVLFKPEIDYSFINPVTTIKEDIYMPIEKFVFKIMKYKNQPLICCEFWKNGIVKEMWSKEKTTIETDNVYTLTFNISTPNVTTNIILKGIWGDIIKIPQLPSNIIYYNYTFYSWKNKDVVYFSGDDFSITKDESFDAVFLPNENNN